LLCYDVLFSTITFPESATLRKSSVVILLMLLCHFSWSQTKTQSHPPAKTSATGPAKAKVASAPAEAQQSIPGALPASAASVPADAAVITVDGVCAGSAQPCKTVITKAEFEKAMDLLKVPPTARRDFGNTYATLLSLSEIAEKQGVQNDPAFQKRMEFLRMNTLANLLQQKMQSDIKVDDQDIQSFYAENTSKFEETDLSRIMIPKSSDKSVDAKALADKLHDRAAAGESMDKLQDEAWKAVKAPGAPPKTDLGWRRGGMMDPRHEKELAGLKAGDVSVVIEDPQDYFVYKVNGRRMIPVEQEKDNIERAIRGEKMQAEAKAMMEKIKPEFNEAYFGKEPAPRPGENENEQPQANPAPAPKK